MTTRKPSTAIKIRRALNRGLSPSEVSQRTGASLGYVYAIKSKMIPAPAPAQTEPAPEIIKLDVPLIPFAPIPAGIAGLHEVKEEQPIAAHAASEIVEEAVIEKPEHHKYLWLAGGGILLLTFIMLWYFGHRG